MDKVTNPYQQKPVNLGYQPLKLEPVNFEQIDLSGLQPSKTLDIPETGENSDFKLGDSALKNAGGIMKFGAQQYNNFTDVSRSSKESTGQTIQSGMSGAALGMQVAGPIGGAVGGAIGVGLGLLDSSADTKKRIEETDNEMRELFEERKARRKHDYKLSQGQKTSAAEGSVLGQQNKFINRYS